MTAYDEQDLVERLSVLGRESKTAFAVLCAERLLPLYGRYVEAAGDGDLEVLRGIVERIWRVLDDSGDDLTDAPAVVDRMVPDEDVVVWVPELAYGQSGAIAGAYAVDVWLGDDPQRAAWAARQVFDVAEYAGRPPVEGVTFEEAGAEDPSLSSREVQIALEAIEADLSAIEQSGTTQLDALRRRAQRDATDWVTMFR